MDEVVAMLMDMVNQNMMISHPMDARVAKKEAIGEKITIMGLVKVVTDMGMGMGMDMGMDMDTNMKPNLNMVTRKNMVVTTMAKKIMLPKKNMGVMTMVRKIMLPKKTMVVIIMARKKDMETNMDTDMDMDTEMDINTNKSMKRKITPPRKITVMTRKIMAKKKNMATETKIMAKKKDMATDTSMDPNTDTATKKNMARSQATAPVKNMDMDTIEDLMEDLTKIDITSTSFWTLMLFMGTSQGMEVDRMNVVENMEEDTTTDHHTISMMLFTISLLVAGATLQFTLIIALILMALDKDTEEAIMEEPCPSHPIPTVLGQPAHPLTGNPLNNPHLGNQDNKIGKVHRLKPGLVNPKSKPKQHQLGTLQLN